MKTAICTHVKSNGTVCESPALKGKKFCYFHAAARERSQRQLRAVRMQLPFQLPLLEDANAIQVAIGDTLNALLAGQIDHKTAGLVLYGLQSAAANIRHTDFEVTDFDRHVTEYKFEDLPEENENQQAAPAAVPESVASQKQATLPPKKSPYSAEEKALLDEACKLAMQRARDIKKQVLG